jgi:hypothetical protein
MGTDWSGWKAKPTCRRQETTEYTEYTEGGNIKGSCFFLYSVVIELSLCVMAPVIGSAKSVVELNRSS